MDHVVSAPLSIEGCQSRNFGWGRYLKVCVYDLGRRRLLGPNEDIVRLGIVISPRVGGEHPH